MDSTIKHSIKDLINSVTQLGKTVKENLQLDSGKYIKNLATTFVNFLFGIREYREKFSLGLFDLKNLGPSLWMKKMALNGLFESLEKQIKTCYSLVEKLSQTNQLENNNIVENIRSNLMAIMGTMAFMEKILDTLEVKNVVNNKEKVETKKVKHGNIEDEVTKFLETDEEFDEAYKKGLGIKKIIGDA